MNKKQFKAQVDIVDSILRKYESRDSYIRKYTLNGPRVCRVKYFGFRWSDALAVSHIAKLPFVASANVVAPCGIASLTVRFTR